ncbi:hypothetical protein [Salinimicrobium oceani]|uniref:Secreted protein n=1 Tax=Salinimicrobium oceani TaxID=2722702 RepID=A0ABX1CWY2_9FLAO|nr:hypothetical protein [Salinimicrobium oceani]NJW52440.1 hypothetical protein [Salinimicrobium oceani]
MKPGEEIIFVLRVFFGLCLKITAAGYAAEEQEQGEQRQCSYSEYPDVLRKLYKCIRKAEISSEFQKFLKFGFRLKYFQKQHKKEEFRSS